MMMLQLMGDCSIESTPLSPPPSLIPPHVSSCFIFPPFFCSDIFNLLMIFGLVLVFVVWQCIPNMATSINTGRTLSFLFVLRLRKKADGTETEEKKIGNSKKNEREVIGV